MSDVKTRSEEKVEVNKKIEKAEREKTELGSKIAGSVMSNLNERDFEGLDLKGYNFDNLDLKGYNLKGTKLKDFGFEK